MTFGRLLLRNLLYHWRGNLAVLLGVVVGAAVLTGALLVGDSLRGSLRDLALERLGGVEYALLPGRFFRQELAAKVSGTFFDAKKAPDAFAAVVMLQGSAVAGDAAGSDVRRSPRITVYGVDEHFWPAGQMPLSRDFWNPAELPALGDRTVVLGASLAHDLGARAGDHVILNLPRVSGAPRETVLGKRKTEDVLATLRLKVAAVLPEENLGSHFSLSPGSVVPRNAFLPLAVLQEELRFQDRALPEQPVNAVLARAGAPDELQQELRRHLRLEDLGLILREVRRKGAAGGYLSLESSQLFLRPDVLQAARETRLTVAPTLVYLVNNIAEAKQQTATAAALLAPPGPVPLLRPMIAYYGPLQAPYAIVAALEAGRQPPLGTFLPRGMRKLAEDQIALVRWEGSPLTGARPGDVLTLTYFPPQEEGRLHEQTAAFRVAAVIPLQGAANDRNLTPRFPGITDRLTLDAWDPPFPFDRTRLRPADEEFWSAHRATPKAYINLKTGRRLWGSRFGEYTSLRLLRPPGLRVAELSDRLLSHLHPERLGMSFLDVRARGLEASTGSSDFGGLFLGFSSFLIAAALLLVGLLFRLNLDRRASEVGLLLAAGFRRGKVRRLLLLEGGLLALLGAALGCAGALLYAGLLLRFLGASWPGGLDRSFLQLHATPASFLVGYAGSVAVSVLTIFWATRVLARVPPSALLAGTTVTTMPQAPTARRWNWSLWIAGVAGVGAVASLVAGFLVSDHEAQAGSFFSGGGLVLIALLAFLWARLRTGRRRQTGPTHSLAALGVRNASRHPLRSVLTVGLLAAATFLVVAVQAFHRDPGRDFLGLHGGSGGFALLAESELPIYQDLNTAQGQQDLGLSEQARQALKGVRFFPLRLGPGDDVSCLNLYRPLRPRLLGVPPALVARGGFHFAATLASTPEEKANPWLLLRKPAKDEPIPVFGEANTVTWILKSGLGQELRVPDEHGILVRLRIVGLFEDSVFQSELVTSEANFLTLLPHQEGYQRFLIDVPPAQAVRVKTVLESGLAGLGFAVTPAGERLASYLAVENTYLATFQALGGLGLLLGALGLAVVLLRSVWERRGELALLRAVGFRRSTLAWLVLAENGTLLAVGLAVGTIAALLTVAPHLSAAAGELMWLRLLVLLGLVLIVGLASAATAVAATLRAPLLPALRRE
jgi:putative ABC transport system permease protein